MRDMTGPRKAAEDIERELEFHTQMLVRRFVDEGLSEDDARARAMARLGATDRVRRECGAIADDMETAPMARTSWWRVAQQDTRYAVRVLWRTKLFTATALLTLAVGVGATTAIFSVVNAVLLRKLPYPSADRAMVIFGAYQQAGLEQAAMSPEEFADLRANARAFDQLAGVRPQTAALTGDCGTGSDCEPERVHAYAVSPELFDLLGVAPSHGRSFTKADGITGAPTVVIISDGLWQRRFGGDLRVIGRRITLAGVAREVVGVMPASVRFPDEPVGYMKDRGDLWVPFNWEERKDGRGNQYLVVFGRRRPEVTAAQADADLANVSAGFIRELPDRYAEPKVHWRLGAMSLTEAMIGDVRAGLLMLFGAVVCVLLIACANVANLTLARGTTRRRELAVRSALGANRARLIQQLLIETLVLTSVGAALGVGVAAGALKILVALSPGNIPRLDSASLDGTVLGFAVGLALITAFVVGLLPAIRQANVDPQSSLGDGVRGTDTTSPRRRLRGLLVMAEVTTAVIVLVGASLLIRSFMTISRVPVGLSADGVAIAELALPRASYSSPESVANFHQALTRKLASLPGVTLASAVYPMPLSGEGWSGSVVIDNRSEVLGQPEPHAEFAVAMPRYFSTVGVPLLEGRDFADTDTATSPQVVIVDRAFADTYWPGESAIGKRVSPFGDPGIGPWAHVIGVVGHVRNKGARTAGEGQLYLPALQKTEYSLFYLARTSANPHGLMPAIRSAVRAQDARLPMASLTTMPDLVAKFTARERFTVLLFTIFGVVALVLAAIGLYGVLAFLVTQRTREIGIRMALGGRSADIVRGVIGEGLTLTLVGLAAGLGGAFLLARSMKSLLFHIEATDVTTYAVVSAVMVVVALLAALGPARRATRVNPVDVLRG
jgi:putative ABC transport system permease protein